MGRAITTIPIHPAAGQAGCGGCLHDAGAPVCRTTLGEPCQAPSLHGSPEAVRAVMAALGPVLGFADDADSAPLGTGQVQSLTVQPGEVDLVLASRKQCGGAVWADLAFQALRRLLPDTDIYVRNAA